MRYGRLMVFIAVTITAALVALPQTPASAAAVLLPPGTPVGLRFMTPVDSGTAAVGAPVNFQVYADVMTGGRIVIRRGARATGTVVEVTKPGMFGASAKIVIGSMRTMAIDGSTVALHDVTVSKALVSKARVGAAGATVAGAIVLGPVGLLAGALVRGGSIRVPAGTTVTDATEATARIMTR